MAECPGGRNNRGTRSQFRIRAPSLLKGPYPVHLGDIMDIGQSSQTGILSGSDLVSPNKGTRTRTVREYEQTISELKKENFDLKLRVFLFEEAFSKNSRKDKDSSSPDKDNTVQVTVRLKLELETLRNELNQKEKLLQDALNRSEKSEVEFKELEEKFVELQCQLSSLSELPSKEKFQLIVEEKENISKQNESLYKAIVEKNDEIQVLNDKIEILCNQNNLLEEKIKKKSLAIQAFVYKNYKEREMLPDELRNVVISAAEAAKKRNKQDLVLAVKSFNAALNQIMCSSVKGVSNESRGKENISCSQTKCLNEEVLEESSVFLPSQTKSCIELNYFQSLNEVLSEKNVPVAKSVSSLDSTVQDRTRGKISDSSIAERDIIDFRYHSVIPCKAEKENLISFSNTPGRICSNENNLINIENVSSTQSFNSMQLDENTYKNNIISTSNNSSEISAEVQTVLKENELKLCIKEKLAVIHELKANCKELEQKQIQIPEVSSRVSKILEYSDVHTQTDVTGCNLLQLQEMSRLEKDAKLSNNVDELREDILLLLLTIEGKNQELTDVKKTLSSVQEDLKRALNSSKITSNIDMDFENERKELLEKLASSYSINVELMRHLQNLETFMENLLQHKLDSSAESISERSDFISSVSKCLNESLKLSYALSDHLSICEGSKMFEEYGSFLSKNVTLSDERSFFHLDTSTVNLPDRSTMSDQRKFVQEGFFSFLDKKEIEEVSKKIFESLLLQGDQVCTRCWHKMNSVQKPELSHSIPNYDVPSKSMAYLSSDSDIWSEPDRDLSMQRMGISLKNSPSISKSPRKYRLKDRRMSNKLSPEWSTSSLDKQTRNGSVSRRLFAKEALKDEMFAFEKYIYILSEKFSRLNLLLNNLEGIREEKMNEGIWNKLTEIVTSVGEALQKLQAEKENGKSFTLAICGKCTMIELLVDLKMHYNQMGLNVPDMITEDEVKDFQKFVAEMSELVEEFQELLPPSTNIQKSAKSTQCQLLTKNEEVEINRLKQKILELDNENTVLNEKLSKIKESLSKEGCLLDSVKTENSVLSNQIQQLKEKLWVLEQKEEELLQQNAELNDKYIDAYKSNVELNSILKDIEQKRNESDIVFNQLTEELHQKKLDLISLNAKCLEYEKELEKHIKLKDEFAEKIKTLEKSSNSEREEYFNKIEDLNKEKNSCIEKLKTSEKKIVALEEQSMLLNNNLEENSKECCLLQGMVETLQNQKENLNITCKDLQEQLDRTKEQSKNLQERCALYEKEVLVKQNMKEGHWRELKQLETQFACEKEKLLSDISLLLSERDNVLEKIKDEKEQCDKLMKEKSELSQKLDECYSLISSLRHSNEEMEATHLNMGQKNELIHNALSSSNTKCDTLSKDLKMMRETLQSLESKCLEYERELTATSGIKDTLLESLININNEFVTNQHKLNELCKVYGYDSGEARGNIISDFPVINKCNVKNICDGIIWESKKLLETADILMSLFKNFHIKSQEVINADERNKIKWECLEKQAKMQAAEIEHMKSQNNHLERVVEELRNNIAECETSAKLSAFEIESLKAKLCSAENEVEHGKSMLKIKEDEITHLQERLFNLQTYMNTVIAEKTDIQNKSATCQTADVEKTDSSAQSVVDVENSSRNLDDSFDSMSSVTETSKSSCCGRIRKKYQALKTKLVLCEKRVEILEKEKNDLRENFMSQMQSKCDSQSFDGQDLLNSKILDLESKLEEKKVFIRELKTELLKTCNSLMNKEKEIDDLKLKLSQTEKKSQIIDSGLSELQSKVKPQAIDINIKNLKNYKWELIQTIFNLQRNFYEKRGIHLDYFNNFKEHVDNLYSIHLKSPVSKSESMPLIWSEKVQQGYAEKDDKLKYLLSLELDIECLENLKIFLNRFFVPCALQNLDVDNRSCEEPSKLIEGRQIPQKNVEIVDSLTLHETAKSKEFSYADSTTANFKAASEKAFSFEKFALGVIHRVDYIENFFKNAENQRTWLNSIEFSSEEHVLKSEAKMLLQRIFKEVKVVHGEINKVFDVNAALKNLDIFTELIPTSLNKPDTSDQESVMSEETITISRSVSPLSIDEVCPLKLPFLRTTELDEETTSPESLTNKAIVNNPNSDKLVAMSSCDSVCQRSHYSSPDLGIESDPNHDSSAPEHKEDDLHKYQKVMPQEPKSVTKPQPKTAFTSTESSQKWRGTKFPGGSLYCIGNLQQYELLKREIQESLVGIKSVLSRTGEGLPRIARYTSPRKTLEYNTLKAIKDTCANIEVCLKEAYRLVGKFWIAACPSEQEWNALIEENEHLYEQLNHLKFLMQKQENEFKKAMGKLEHAQVLKANMEKKISKKLIKTKKVIRQAELKLLENEFQNFPVLPRYPLEQPVECNSQHKS